MNLAGLYLQIKKEKNKILPAGLRALPATTHKGRQGRKKLRRKLTEKGKCFREAISAQILEAKGLNAGGNFANYA
jgi:hypothetical protein